MIMNKKIFYILALATVVLSGCGFLDKEPDNRTDITTLAQVKKLLATAYSDADYAWICEMSSGPRLIRIRPNFSSHTYQRRENFCYLKEKEKDVLIVNSILTKEKNYETGTYCTVITGYRSV